jgi:hypothetical protein
MPGRRSRPTATELNYLMQLRDEGIEIDPSIFQQNNRSDLRISQGPDLGEIFDLGRYNTGYAISVHLVASSRLYLAECSIESCWHPDIELEEFDDRRPKFGPVSYRPQDVLNSKFHERAVLTRGRVVEGYILAWGTGRIPSTTTNGTYGVRVTILDTLGRSASTELGAVLSRAKPANDSESRTVSEARARTKAPREENLPGDEDGVQNPVGWHGSR